MVLSAYVAIYVASVRSALSNQADCSSYPLSATSQSNWADVCQRSTVCTGNLIREAAAELAIGDGTKVEIVPRLGEHDA